MRLGIPVGMLVVVLSCNLSSLAQAPAKGTPAQEAAKLWESAMSPWRSGDYKACAALLEKFIAAFPTNENIPDAYMKLGYCRLTLKDPEKYLAAVNDIIDRFQGSPSWYAAYANKLAYLKDKKDNDGYLKTLEAFIGKLEEAPLDLYDHPVNYWTYYMNREAYFAPGWVRDVVAMADTPERAAKALRLLNATLQEYSADLPPEWQFAHVSLLRTAGKNEDAEKFWRKYTEARAGDPRGSALWLMEANAAIARKDNAATDAIYARLFKTWGGSGGLEEAMYSRLVQLSSQDRYDEFMQLARLFGKYYGPADQRGYTDAVMNLVATIAVRPLSAPRPKPITTPTTATTQPRPEEARIAPALVLLDELAGKHPLNIQANLRRKFQIYLAAEMVPQAAELAAEFVGPKQWCAENFDLVGQYVNTDPAFAKIITEARERWKVPLPNPTSKAFPMLNQLRLRLKEDQLRHAEEIVEEMFTQFRDDPSTIDAINLFAEYCFAKVLVEPRDKWLARMVENYATHPVAQAVLSRQIAAQLADQQYDALAKSVEMAMTRFPGAGAVTTWQSYRLRCYEAVQDAGGKYLYAKSVYGPRADAGEIGAMQELGRYELEKYTGTDFVPRGTYWLEQADTHPGTRAELWCLSQAITWLYILPVRHYGTPGDWEHAYPVRARLAKQTLDPELAWQHTMMDVTMLAEQDKPADALKALDGYLKDKTTVLDLNVRVKLASLGRSLGKANMGNEGVALVKRLEKLCLTQLDQRAILQMQAAMYYAAKRPADAAGFYLTLVEKSRAPMEEYGSFLVGIQYLAEAASPRYPQEIERYLKRIERVQEVVPGLLYRLGAYYAGAKNPAAMQVWNRLNTRYPASAARDQLEAVLKK